MIPFVDANGQTVHLSKAEVAVCLTQMKNPPGWYILVPFSDDMQKVGGNTVVQVRLLTRHPEKLYNPFQRLMRVLRRKSIPSPLWLKLKRNRPYAICIT